MRLDPAMRKIPTYDELINDISEDRTVLKYPSRLYTFFSNSPAYLQVLANQKETSDHQTQVHHYHAKEHEITQMASQTGVTAAEIKEILRDMPGGVPGRDGRDGQDGLHGNDGHDGDDGMDGPQGAQGIRGETGVGIQGPPGIDAPMSQRPPPPPPPPPAPATIAERDTSALRGLIQNSREDTATQTLLGTTSPPTVFTPAISGIEAGLRAQIEHDKRMRELEKQAHADQLVQVAIENAKKSSMADAANAALHASISDAGHRAEARAVAAQDALMRNQAASLMEAQRRNHDAQMAQMRMLAERQRSITPAGGIMDRPVPIISPAGPGPPAPSTIISQPPARHYIGDGGEGRARSGKNAPEVDTTRTRKDKRTRDEILRKPPRQPNRRRPRTDPGPSVAQPSPPPPPTPPAAQAPGLAPPGPRPRAVVNVPVPAGTRRVAKDVPGVSTDRTQATKNKKPVILGPAPPKRSRTSNVQSRIHQIETRTLRLL
jgi:hypothetical protein